MSYNWRDDEMKVECETCLGEGSVPSGLYRGGPTSDHPIMRPCQACEGRGWGWIQEDEE